MANVPEVGSDAASSADIVKAMMAGPAAKSKAAAPNEDMGSAKTTRESAMTAPRSTGTTSATAAGILSNNKPQMSRDEKVKLLWGGKKDPAVATIESKPDEIASVVFGHNRWDAAEFSS